MTTVVLDANTFISATLVPVGISAQIVKYARSRHFTLVTNDHIIMEATRALTYPRIQRKYNITEANIARLRRFLRRRAVITPLTVTVEGVATHPEDDLVLATAASAKADYLVTGDSKLQKLKAFQGVKIISPRRCLEILESQENHETQESIEPHCGRARAPGRGCTQSGRPKGAAGTKPDDGRSIFQSK